MGSLQEGDDFGSLALLNNAPRSATIILAESEVHLIRVDKSDYFRILKVSCVVTSDISKKQLCFAFAQLI